MATPPLIEAADVAIDGNSTATSSWSVPHNAYASGDLVVFFLSNDASTTHTRPTLGPNSEVITDLTVNFNTGTNGPTISAWRFIGTGTVGASTVTVTSSTDDQWAGGSFVVPAGEFDPANPIEAFNTDGRNANGTTATSPALTGITADGTVLAWVAIDTDPFLTNPSAWTQIGTFDAGQVAARISTRDAATTTSETIAAATWTMASDSFSSLGFVVNAVPDVGGGAGYSNSLGLMGVG